MSYGSMLMPPQSKKEPLIMTDTTRIGEARDATILTQFNMAMALETENRQLDRATVTAGVLSLIGNPAAGFYVVAEQGGDVVAALMVTYEWSDWRNRCFWWIQSVYVRPSHRRQGIFKKLFEGVKSMASSGTTSVACVCTWNRTTPSLRPPTKASAWTRRTTTCTKSNSTQRNT